jgi:hypothetical protein
MAVSTSDSFSHAFLLMVHTEWLFERAPEDHSNQGDREPSLPTMVEAGNQLSGSLTSRSADTKSLY